MGVTAAGPATPAGRGPSRPLRAAGRRVRLGAVGVVLALLTAGTVAGQDGDFPFGPFRMYATRDDPDGTVVQAVVLARDADGTVHDVTETAGTPRRSELEGRLSVFEVDPAAFTALGPAYAHRSAVVAVTLVRREFHLAGGRRVRTVDVPLATWTRARGDAVAGGFR